MLMEALSRLLTRENGRTPAEPDDVPYDPPEGTRN